MAPRSISVPDSSSQPANLGEVPIEATRRFLPEARSVGAVRRFVASALAEWDHAWEIDVVVFLTSEVVTNAVVHGGPYGPSQQLEVRVARRAGVVRVEVADGHPGVPVPGAAGPDETSGRGLALLEALACAWGTSPGDPGKVVWFAVRA
ncbi:MAG: ATP-binding protein [Acidimicrobiales bacterium]